jgi:hypothetical protein
MFSLEFMASNLLRPPPLTIMLGHCLQHQIIMSHIDSNKLPSLPFPRMVSAFAQCFAAAFRLNEITIPSRAQLKSETPPVA